MHIARAGQEKRGLLLSPRRRLRNTSLPTPSSPRYPDLALH